MDKHLNHNYMPLDDFIQEIDEFIMLDSSYNSILEKALAFLPRRKNLMNLISDQTIKACDEINQETASYFDELRQNFPQTIVQKLKERQVFY